MKRIFTLLTIEFWMFCFVSCSQDTPMQNIIQGIPEERAGCVAYKRQLRDDTASSDFVDVLGMRMYAYNMTLHTWSLTFDFDSKIEAIHTTANEILDLNSGDSLCVETWLNLFKAMSDSTMVLSLEVIRQNELFENLIQRTATEGFLTEFRGIKFDIDRVIWFIQEDHFEKDSKCFPHQFSTDSIQIVLAGKSQAACDSTPSS